jgi:uncharacterized membrane protein SpoIIM required for sporulation
VVQSGGISPSNVQLFVSFDLFLLRLPTAFFSVTSTKYRFFSMSEPNQSKTPKHRDSTKSTSEPQSPEAVVSCSVFKYFSLQQ